MASLQIEAIREKGQFWTPAWVTRAMMAYVSTDSKSILDPAFGEGAFYIAFKERPVVLLVKMISNFPATR